MLTCFPSPGSGQVRKPSLRLVSGDQLTSISGRTGLGFADAEGSLQCEQTSSLAVRPSSADDLVEGRIPFALQVIPLVLFLVAWMFLPESPHWLALQGRHDEARYVLRRLRMAPEGDPRALELL